MLPVAPQEPVMAAEAAIHAFYGRCAKGVDGRFRGHDEIQKRSR